MTALLRPLLRKRLFKRPSLTPMIDVVFLLLLFFLLATQFKSATAIELGAANAHSSAINKPPYLIEIGKGLMLGGNPINQTELITTIQGNPSRSIAIRTSNTSVKDFIALVDHIRELGIKDIVLVENTQ